MSILYSGERWEVRKEPVSEGKRLLLSFECTVGPVGVRTFENERSLRKAKRLLCAQLEMLAASAQAAANALAEPELNEQARKAD